LALEKAAVLRLVQEGCSVAGVSISLAMTFHRVSRTDGQDAIFTFTDFSISSS
jgi:hypothetical protein